MVRVESSFPQTDWRRSRGYIASDVIFVVILFICYVCLNILLAKNLNTIPIIIIMKMFDNFKIIAIVTA